WVLQLFEQLFEKCEGATGSLAIVASNHGPSHPCGVTPRIAIANDARGEPQVGGGYTDPAARRIKKKTPPPSRDPPPRRRPAHGLDRVGLLMRRVRWSASVGVTCGNETPRP